MPPGKLGGFQRHKVNKLLYMEYRPRELANELGVDVRYVYRYWLPLGCPHRRDERRHIWIVGTEFAKWYRETYQRRKLAADEAYCVSCKQVVPIGEYEVVRQEEITFLTFLCPSCGRKAAKILPHDKP